MFHTLSTSRTLPEVLITVGACSLVALVAYWLADIEAVGLQGRRLVCKTMIVDVFLVFATVVDELLNRNALLSD